MKVSIKSISFRFIVPLECTNYCDIPTTIIHSTLYIVYIGYNAYITFDNTISTYYVWSIRHCEILINHRVIRPTDRPKNKEVLIKTQ